MGKFTQDQTSSSMPGRKWQPLGFATAGTVAAGAQGTASTQPPFAFKGQRLVVPSAIAGFFDINAITVNNIPQLASANAIPAAAFVENATLTDLSDMMDCPPMGTIAITATNNDAAVHAFKAVLFGWSDQKAS